MDAQGTQELVAALNALPAAQRQVVLDTLPPDRQKQLLAAGLVLPGSESSAAVRDARLAEISAMEKQRSSQLWGDANTCYTEMDAAVKPLYTSFASIHNTKPDVLLQWRRTFTNLHNTLASMERSIDGLAAAGMPALEADALAVRNARKVLGSKIQQDKESVEKLLKACDDLNVLFRSFGWFQQAPSPLNASPSV